MVSTRRVKPTTSKATVSERVSVLAKSRSEEEVKNRVSQTLEHLLENERTKMAFSHELSFCLKESSSF